MSIVEELNKLNKGIPKKETKDIPRCSEHGLYLYYNGLTINNEIIGTCKLGCCEFWTEDEWKEGVKKND